MKKKCSKCFKVKHISSFSKRASSRDGFGYKCKECRQLRWVIYYKKNKKRIIKQRLDWAKNNKDKILEYNKTPARKKAMNANQRVYHAIRTGKIKKGVCEKCGNKKVEAHHDDYNKPLKIKWLCVKCHRKLHKIYADNTSKNKKS